MEWNPTPFNDLQSKRSLVLASMCYVACLLLLSLIVILFRTTARENWTTGHFFLMQNLMIATLINVILYGTIWLLSGINAGWTIINRDQCTLVASLVYFFAIQNFVSIIGLSLDRYYLITSLVRSRFRWKIFYQISLVVSFFMAFSPLIFLDRDTQSSIYGLNHNQSSVSSLLWKRVFILETKFLCK
jgi:hypothetical protein